MIATSHSELPNRREMNRSCVMKTAGGLNQYRTCENGFCARFHAREYALTSEQWQLEYMQNHEKREKCIKVDIKAVTPLHILAPGWLHYQVTIGQQPAKEGGTWNAASWLESWERLTDQNMEATNNPTPMQSTKMTHSRNLMNATKCKPSTRAKPTEDAGKNEILSKGVVYMDGRITWGEGEAIPHSQKLSRTRNAGSSLAHWSLVSEWQTRNAYNLII